jgi:hypothetical protein
MAVSRRFRWLAGFFLGTQDSAASLLDRTRFVADVERERRRLHGRAGVLLIHHSAVCSGSEET